MPRLDTSISPGLWAALKDHARKTHEPLAHVIRKALAEYLRVSHHTLYQVSTATALVEGIYQGAVRVGTLREHGDLGRTSTAKWSSSMGGSFRCGPTVPSGNAATMC